MKKRLFLLYIITQIFLTNCLHAQTPQGINYQGVARSGNGKPLVNKSIKLRLNILNGASNGNSIYAETHTSTTGSGGLFNITIGAGTPLSGTFSAIDWSTGGSKWVKVEIDTTGGNNYQFIGSQQLMSVPYALYAKKAGIAENGIPSGGTTGQVLTNCDGLPIWTSGGICPSKVTSLNCAEATNNGTLTSGQAANGVNSSIPYTGGNGGSYNGQLVNSTGVTGLTATLAPGNFANGSGSLTYNITGTPSNSGTASFALNIGGQACTLSRNVISIFQAGISKHTCGAINVHNSNLSYGTMTDQEGNVYNTIAIGTQVWMAENLKTTVYRNGNPIANVTNATQWSGLTTGAWSQYDNNSSFGCPYGKLYNWYAVADPRNLCPAGWHVPSDADLNVLQNNLGGWSVAGGKLKTQGITHWTSGNTGATNSSGFSGLPGGLLGPNGEFDTQGILAHFWTSTLDISQTDAVLYRLHFGEQGLDRFIWDNRHGFSVRCLKD